MARPALSPYLFDRRYWLERLARIERSRAHLRYLPRDGWSGEDHRATELWLRALDGSRLRALLVEPTFARARAGLAVIAWERPRTTDATAAAPEATDADHWPDLDALAARAAEGRAVLVLAIDRERRLEDRVLDLVRTIDAARHGLHGPFVPKDGPIDVEGDDDAAEIGRHVLAMHRRSSG